MQLIMYTYIVGRVKNVIRYNIILEVQYARVHGYNVHLNGFVRFVLVQATNGRARVFLSYKCYNM